MRVIYGYVDFNGAVEMRSGAGGRRKKSVRYAECKKTRLRIDFLYTVCSQEVFVFFHL